MASHASLAKDLSGPTVLGGPAARRFGGPPTHRRRYHVEEQGFSRSQGAMARRVVQRSLGASADGWRTGRGEPRVLTRSRHEMSDFDPEIGGFFCSAFRLVC